MNAEEAWLLKEKYNGEKTEGFFADCERLKLGKPLAYLIGHIPFLNTTIYLDNTPLIPRVETEFWVQKAIKEMSSRDTPTLFVLDLCAGSGCIGVAVAHARPLSTVHFAEFDANLHTTITKNCAENAISSERIEVFGGDLYENITQKYDFILSNPPYLPNGSSLVADSVKAFEPARALYGGDDGLMLIRRIIAEAKKHLTNTGVLYIEHEPQQITELNRLAQENNLIVTTHTDQYSVPRYSRFTVAQ
jgi:HemK-like putative methylase